MGKLALRKISDTAKRVILFKLLQKIEYKLIFIENKLVIEEALKRLDLKFLNN
jgi:hypothetical protein